MKKLLVALFASAFALTAFAQAQKADPAAPKGRTGVETKKATPATPPATSTKVEADKKKVRKAKSTTKAADKKDGKEAVKK
jgi:hypothetical protein